MLITWVWNILHQIIPAESLKCLENPALTKIQII